MDGLKTTFQDEVARLRAWVEHTSMTERWTVGEGEWESTYPEWRRIDAIWTQLLAQTNPSEWSSELTTSALYAIARNNEQQRMLHSLVASGFARFEVLAEQSLVAADEHARWQFAHGCSLFRLPAYAEGDDAANAARRLDCLALLERFAADPDEYVRLCAATSLQAWSAPSPP